MGPQKRDTFRHVSIVADILEVRMLGDQKVHAA